MDLQNNSIYLGVEIILIQCSLTSNTNKITRLCCCWSSITRRCVALAPLFCNRNEDIVYSYTCITTDLALIIASYTDKLDVVQLGTTSFEIDLLYSLVLRLLLLFGIPRWVNTFP